jgi:hypothetical protein
MTSLKKLYESSAKDRLKKRVKASSTRTDTPVEERIRSILEKAFRRLPSYKNIPESVEEIGKKVYSYLPETFQYDKGHPWEDDDIVTYIPVKFERGGYVELDQFDERKLDAYDTPKDLTDALEKEVISSCNKKDLNKMIQQAGLGKTDSERGFYTEVFIKVLAVYSKFFHVVLFDTKIS